MTGFIIACVGMVLLSGALIAWPLFRKFSSLPAANRWLTVVLAVVVIGAISGGIYGTHTYQRGGWNADNAPATGRTEDAQLAQAIKQLEALANQNSNDAQAWIKLGAALVMAHRIDQSISTYQHAYDITHGQVIDAVTGLAEALLTTRTEAAFTRASGLLDDALRMQPNNPKALWYGGMVALQLNNLTVARERFRNMLTLNGLPANLRGMLEREVQDLDQQLGTPSPGTAAAASSAHSIIVNVKLDPKLKDQIKSPMTLFILARDPNQPGPPLAVQRHMATEIPVTVELSKANAMLATRTIEGVDAVEVVARLSASGTPMQQSGDYAGSVQYSFSKQGAHGVVTIEINHQVP
jgi:cytochrome c-type biogenesis protein CcmH